MHYNIYDLVGNCWEYTMATTLNDPGLSRIARGDYSDNHNLSYSISYEIFYGTDNYERNKTNTLY